MTAWKYKINIRQYLNDEETPEAVLKAAEGIKAEIEKNHLERIFLNTPYKMVERTRKAVDAGFDYDEVCAIFNGWLGRIYDIADDERVWVSG